MIDLKPGVTLGRYEILMPVARGGMAAVWAARLVGSRGFQKLVAIKTMLPALSEDPEFEAMFLNEARLASRVRHPHVAEILDLGDEAGWLYLVMEWIYGETIFTLNKRAKNKGIPLPLLIRIVSSACAGLHAAHELRDDRGRSLDLVHRDISPQNIMISFDGIVKIVDFGVAKAAGHGQTRVPGMVKGKIPYLSPEQIAGSKLDRRSDIFALGILMYVMVSGRHPFRGETELTTMENICTRSPVPLRELVPGTRADVEAVVLRALEKHPNQRFPDCAEMQRALDQILNAMGAAVTDGDVAKFVRSVMGDLMEERREQLAAAIQQADAALSSEPASRRPASLQRPLGGAPLPATFEGILPVALDEDDPKSGSKRVSRPAAARQAPRAAPPPVSPSPPQAVAAAHSKSRSGWGWYVLGLLVIVVAAAGVCLRAGLLPPVISAPVTAHLPPLLHFLLPPQPPATSTAPPEPSPPAEPLPSPDPLLPNETASASASAASASATGAPIPPPSAPATLLPTGSTMPPRAPAGPWPPAPREPQPSPYDYDE